MYLPFFSWHLHICFATALRIYRYVHEWGGPILFYIPSEMRTEQNTGITFQKAEPKWGWLSDPKLSANNFVAELQSPKVMRGESPGDVRIPDQIKFLHQEHFILHPSIAAAVLPISLTQSAQAFLCALEGGFKWSNLFSEWLTGGEGISLIYMPLSWFAMQLSNAESAAFNFVKEHFFSGKSQVLAVKNSSNSCSAYN